MMIAALYARVSSKRQEQEATIESQLAQLLAFAQNNGYQIPAQLHFIDEAVSGSTLRREGLDRLRNAAASGQVNLLLCLAPDRLARNLGVQQLLLSELSHFGVEVIFTTQPMRGETPNDQLLLNIQGAFAEYERAVISDRLRRGRLHRLRTGLSVPYPAPYGYYYQPATDGEKSCWVVIDEQAEVVRQIYSWYTGPDEYSISEIARRLNEQEMAAPAGSKWGTSSVRRILGYPCYKGTTYYNRHQTDYSAIGRPKQAGPGRLTSARHLKRPESEWIEIAVPAIISEVTWDMAQKRFEMNARFSARNSKRIYLLKGLLVCRICERTLQGRAQRGVTYYRCPGGGQNRACGVPKHSCTLRADSCEDAIWEQLADLLNQPQKVKLAWPAHQATLQPPHLVRWQKRIKELNKQRLRLLDAYQAGVIELDELSRRQNPIKTERRQLEAKLANASGATATTIRLEDFQRKIQQALAASDRKTQQQLIRLLIDRIVVADKVLTVHHLIPLMNDSLLHSATPKA